MKYLGYSIANCEIVDDNTQKNDLFRYKLGYYGDGRVKVKTYFDQEKIQKINTFKQRGV